MSREHRAIPRLGLSRNLERDTAMKEIPEFVKSSPRMVAHQLVAGCPGFSGGDHTNKCNELENTLIQYARWRVFKEREHCARLADKYPCVAEAIRDQT